MPTVNRVAKYLAAYVTQYQNEYSRFTTPPPVGGGYPKIPISPYQFGSELVCHLATDGAVVLDTTNEPSYNWDVAGGPAIMADMEPTKAPSWVAETLKAEGLLGKDIGIYRVVSHSPIPASIWRGDLGDPVEQTTLDVNGVRIEIRRYRYGWEELIRRLTYGVFGLILNSNLPSIDTDFWHPQIITAMGFFPADRHTRRYFRYAELLRHADAAAWDSRAAWVRAHVDVRRDFARAVSQHGKAGGNLTLGKQDPPVGPPFYDRLDALQQAADGLATLLEDQPNAPESVFHEYLRTHPVLIDVYGGVDSKPRFRFPDIGPTGKSYVEPDFIVRFSNSTYRLIELERPDHLVSTGVGHPRVAVTHAAYQIAEWKDYIANHYDQIRDIYPGISSGFSTGIVISRDSEKAFGGADRDRYISMLRNQLNVDEVWTYDDLVLRARVAVAQLQSLAVSLADYPGAPD